MVNYVIYMLDLQYTIMFYITCLCYAISLALFQTWLHSYILSAVRYLASISPNYYDYCVWLSVSMDEINVGLI